MSDSWREAYSGLRKYAAGNPKVEIGKSVIAIPADVRPEFYRLFDTVRAAFVEEKFADLTDEARILSEHYIRVEEEVTKSLRLDSVSMLTDLHRFLHDPKDSLIKRLRGSLFDLLKGKIDDQTFERVASRNIKATFENLYRLGYQKWVALSLLKLIKADKAFHVSIAHLTALDTVFHDDLAKKVPPPEESEQLSFEHEPFVVFVVPDFIVHSARMKRYVAVRAELGKATTAASEVNDNREWYPVNSMVNIKPDLLIYIDDRPDDLVLIADARRICRPDLIIECVEQKGSLEKEGLEKIKFHHDFLKPRLGTYIVSKDAVSEEDYREVILEQASDEDVKEEKPEKQAADIHIVAVGFNKSNLSPIISQLMNQENGKQPP